MRAIDAYRRGNWAPLVGTSEEARADAFARVRAFLQAPRPPAEIR
ncbi:hypothetical protein [Methylobacterium sp. JK268]